MKIKKEADYVKNVVEGLEYGNLKPLKIDDEKYVPIEHAIDAAIEFAYQLKDKESLYRISQAIPTIKSTVLDKKDAYNILEKCFVYLAESYEEDDKDISKYFYKKANTYGTNFKYNFEKRKYAVEKDLPEQVIKIKSPEKIDKEKKKKIKEKMDEYFEKIEKTYTTANNEFKNYLIDDMIKLADFSRNIGSYSTADKIYKILEKSEEKEVEYLVKERRADMYILMAEKKQKLVDKLIPEYLSKKEAAEEIEEIKDKYNNTNLNQEQENVLKSYKELDEKIKKLRKEINGYYVVAGKKINEMLGYNNNNNNEDEKIDLIEKKLDIYKRRSMIYLLGNYENEDFKEEYNKLMEEYNRINSNIIELNGKIEGYQNKKNLEMKEKKNLKNLLKGHEDKTKELKKNKKKLNDLYVTGGLLSEYKNLFEKYSHENKDDFNVIAKHAIETAKELYEKAEEEKGAKEAAKKAKEAAEKIVNIFYGKNRKYYKLLNNENLLELFKLDGGMDFDNEEYDRAALLFEKASNLDKNDPDVLYYAGISNIKNGNDKRAKKFLKKARELYADKMCLYLYNKDYASKLTEIENLLYNLGDKKQISSSVVIVEKDNENSGEKVKELVEKAKNNKYITIVETGKNWIFYDEAARKKGAKRAKMAINEKLSNGRFAAGVAGTALGIMGGVYLIGKLLGLVPDVAKITNPVDHSYSSITTDPYESESNSEGNSTSEQHMEIVPMIIHGKSNQNSSGEINITYVSIEKGNVSIDESGNISGSEKNHIEGETTTSGHEHTEGSIITNEASYEYSESHSNTSEEETIDITNYWQDVFTGPGGTVIIPHQQNNSYHNQSSSNHSESEQSESSSQSITESFLDKLTEETEKWFEEHSKEIYQEFKNNGEYRVNLSNEGKVVGNVTFREDGNVTYTIGTDEDGDGILDPIKITVNGYEKYSESSSTTHKATTQHSKEKTVRGVEDAQNYVSYLAGLGTSILGFGISAKAGKEFWSTLASYIPGTNAYKERREAKRIISNLEEEKRKKYLEERKYKMEQNMMDDIVEYSSITENTEEENNGIINSIFDGEDSK